MTGSVAIDVFIGLISIFLLYSLLASIIMEALAKYLALRAKITVKTIFKILDDSEFKDETIFERCFSSIRQIRFTDSLSDRPLTSLFYSHPNIKNLGGNNINRKPSSISPDMFADTFIQLLRGDKFNGQENQIELIKINLKLGETDEGVMDLPSWYKAPSNSYKMSAITKAGILRKNGKEKITSKVLQTEIASIDSLAINEMTLYQIKQIIFDSHSDIDVFKKKLVAWYIETSARANGWYIRQTRAILFLIGLFIAIILNVDTLQIVKKLSSDKAARDKMIEFAAQLQANENPNNEIANRSKSAIDSALSKITTNISEANTILGGGKRDGSTLFGGYFITALAISLGASFWFDVLGKVMSIRQSGPKSSPQASTIDDSKKNTDEPIG